MRLPMKKQLVSHLVALVLGLLGGFLGKDLSGLQEPVEKAVEKVGVVMRRRRVGADTLSQALDLVVT